MNRESAAHGNFHFIGPALTVMCQSIKEKVLTLSDDGNIKMIKKGQILYLLHIIVSTCIFTWADQRPKKGYTTKICF